MTDARARLTTALEGRYRLERELGHGGMATVWLAHDLRHDRQVALKVLRPELGAMIGAERFLAEIRTTANLQHPHILPLFDSGEADGLLFYVMPLVEGESLRDRLTREKQLPVEDATRLAGEVAAALDYAHRHGVIHRDIKPENVLLHDGRALVADFGIALAASRAGGVRMTETGLSLGTPHYMSPEQAMGERELDARSDVYSLGAMAYETLAGEPPYTGSTAQAIVAKVITEKPVPLTAHRDTVPPHVAAAIHRALAKLPADRFATAAAFADALTRPGSAATAAFVAAGPRSRRPAVAIAAGAAGAILGGLAALVALRALAGPPDPARPSHLAIMESNVGGSRGPALRRQLAFTPDGETLVFVVVDATGTNSLVRRPLDASEATPIPGTATIAVPIISPDGRWVYGTATDGAWRLPLEGGLRTRLPEEFNYAGFAPDGTFWYTSSRGGILKRLRPGATAPEVPFGEELRLELHQVLGPRTAIVVHRVVGTATGVAYLFDLERGDTTRLLDFPVVEARWTSGHLVWVLPDGALVAAAFDPETRRRGPEVRLTTGVSLTSTGVAQMAVSANGSVAYIPEAPRQLAYVDLQGAARPALPDLRSYHAPQFSPDGRRLSFDFTSGDGRDSWVLDLAQGTLIRTTFTGDGHDATWSPDGRQINYVSARSGALGIYRTRPGGTGVAESLFASTEVIWTGEWLPDGSGIVTTAIFSDARGSDIALLEGGGRGPLRPIVASPYTELYPALSPDARWLAYVSNQSGRHQVYVRPFPVSDADVAVQVSVDGGTEPVWSPDGRRLAYLDAGDGEPALVVAEVSGAGGFTVTARRRLFSTADYIGTAPHANYDWMPDGQGFVMVRRSPSTRVMVIQNLPALVGRLTGGR